MFESTAGFDLYQTREVKKEVNDNENVETSEEVLIDSLYLGRVWES